MLRSRNCQYGILPRFLAMILREFHMQNRPLVGVVVMVIKYVAFLFARFKHP
jgi:hypothetical protein